MMGITIKDLINAPLLQNAKLVGGHDGINKPVQRVSFQDCPLRADIHDRKVVVAGDLIITSLYFHRDNSEELIAFMKTVNDMGCNGLFVSNTLLQFEEREILDEKVLAFAEEIHFPIVLFDCRISYADIISLAMELIISEKKYHQHEHHMDMLLASTNNDEARKWALEINPHFCDSHVVAVLNMNVSKELNQAAKSLMDKLNQRTAYRAFYYQGMIMIILTFPDNSRIPVKNFLGRVKQDISEQIEDYHVGFSNLHEKLGELKEAHYEAAVALQYAAAIQNKTQNYADLGVGRLLIGYQENKEIKRFYAEIVGTLKECDENSGSDLFRTIKTFVKNEGDYKKTSKELFQHENTIRYRLKKARTLLNMEDHELTFLEAISLAMKIDQFQDMDRLQGGRGLSV